MMKKRQIPRICLFCVMGLLLSFTVGCGENSKADGSENSRSAFTFKIAQVSLNKENIEKLSMPEAKILDQIDLRIIKLEDGIFYGLGYGPSGDGYRKKAAFKFDFEGNGLEAIDDKYFFYMDPQEYPKGSNVFCYFQTDADSYNKQFMKIDHNLFEEEMLLDFSVEDINEQVGFCTDGYSVYYQKSKDANVWQWNFADGKKAKIYDAPESAEELFVINDAVYIRLSDACIRIDASRKSSETIIKGLILGRENNEIYFINDNDIICLYDLDTGEMRDSGYFDIEIIRKRSYQKDQIIRQQFYYTLKKGESDIQSVYDMNTGKSDTIVEAPSRRPHSTFSKPYDIGTQTGLLSYPESIIYLWDSEEKKIISQIKHEKIREIFGGYEDRYLIYIIDDNTLGVADIDERIDYVIDLTELIKQTGNPIERWYLEGNFLYAQNICDWDISDDLPDGFYRIDFNQLKNSL